MAAIGFHDRRSPGAPVPGRATAAFRSEEGLHLVIAEIVELMGATGAILTLHVDGGQSPDLLFADRAVAGTPREPQMLAVATAVRADFGAGEPFWRRDVGGTGARIFLIPIDPVPGHGRLVISILFEQPTAAACAQAEELHRGRRPFAIGFFQLWQLNRTLRKRADALGAVLDRTDIGVLLFDRAGQLAYTNRTSEAMLAAGDAIRRNGGGIRATSMADTIVLQTALIHAQFPDRHGRGRPPTPPLMRLRRDGGPALIASVLPPPAPPAEPGDVAAIMYVVDPRLDTASALAPFCRLYGLSPVETALTCHLAAGSAITEAAQKMHIKVQTARSYLKQIFLKTATKRQAELVAMMFSGFIRMNVGSGPAHRDDPAMRPSG